MKEKKAKPAAKPAREDGGTPAPTEKPEKEEPTLTREQAEAVAEVLKKAVELLAFIPPEWLEIARKHVADQKSRYDAIGCMFDPFGMKAKGLFYEQGLEKLGALLRFRRAMDKLEESKRAGLDARMGREKLAGIFGGFGLD